MDLAIIVVLTLGIGISLGMSGYGGFLIPAMLVGFMGMGARDSVANSLWSFVLPGVLGAILYSRKDRFRGWSLPVLLCVGTVPGTLLGRVLSVSLSETLLQIILGSVVLAAGLSLFRRRRIHAAATPSRDANALLTWRSLVVVGAGAFGGLAAVLTGVGGPLITVPILLVLGIEMNKVVGAALINSVVVSLLGAASLSNIATVNPGIVVAITIPQLVGVPIGVWLQHRMTSVRTVPIIAALSTVTGIVLIWRTFATIG